MFFIRKKKTVKLRLKPHFKYKIKYYDILFENRIFIMEQMSSHNKLRWLLNKDLKLKTLLPYNYKYIFNKKIFMGTLKMPGWKKRTWDFIFFSRKVFNDENLYNIWNMKPSYLKYVYSKINRMHPYRQIYNLAYKTLLMFPYAITIKPFTIIFKHYLYNRFFLIFEWSDKLSHSYLLLKIIDKKGKHWAKETNTSIFNAPRKTREIDPSNLLYKLLYINLFRPFYLKLSSNFLFFRKKYTNNLEVILSRKKIKYLLWHRENWLWRLRANWKFIKLHKYIYTKRFKPILLDLFKIKFMEREYYDYFTFDVFLEKFVEVFIKELKELKFINLSNKSKTNKLKFINTYGEKNLYFKSRNNFFKKYSFGKTSFFLRLYNIYFFWVLYFLKNIYLYINKIIFSLWFRFFYFVSNFSNDGNLSRFFTLDLIKYHNLESFNSKVNSELFFISNLSKFSSYYLLFNNISRFKLNYFSFYKSSLLNYKNYMLINKKIDTNFLINFKNFINISYTNISNYYFKYQKKSSNSFFISILDYFEVNNYTFITNFRANYLQTFRSIIGTPRGVLKNIKENNNRVNYDKIYYYFNSIKKEELHYSNFELGLPEDRRMYFL